MTEEFEVGSDQGWGGGDTVELITWQRGEYHGDCQMECEVKGRMLRVVMR